MKASLHALFGTLPSIAENLEIVGTLPDRMETWKNVTVWPGSGVVRRNDGSVEIETIWLMRHLEQCGDYQSRWSWFPCRRSGLYFNLSLFWWANYYHWHCDVLPRLHQALPHLRAETRIILPPGLTRWQMRSLELMGLPFERCVQYVGRRPWKVEKLFYVSPVAMTGDHDEKSLRRVRDMIWQGCLGGPPAKKGWRKLYLQRGHARSRSVVNEAELLPVLKKHGFEMVDCGAMIFDEQVRVLSEAAVVVGPHGAAFTNILWSPPGLKVMEIFEPFAVRRCYWSMCQALGHTHVCGVSDSVPNSQLEPNMKIDADVFSAALSAIGQEL